MKHPALVYISGKRLSRKINTVVLFPFVFHIAVQQLFKQLWSLPMLYDHEPSPATSVLCFKVSTGFVASGQRNLYRSSLLLGTLLRPVLTIQICVAWEKATVSKATADLALRITEIHKLLHHGKLEIQLDYTNIDFIVIFLKTEIR
jgi:hypothetical protein